MWSLKQALSLDGSSAEVAAKRVKKLDNQGLHDAMHNTMSSIVQRVRAADLKMAEEYSEVLVVIIREMKARG